MPKSVIPTSVLKATFSALSTKHTPMRHKLMRMLFNVVDKAHTLVKTTCLKFTSGYEYKVHFTDGLDEHNILKFRGSIVYLQENLHCNVRACR